MWWYLVHVADGEVTHLKEISVYHQLEMSKCKPQNFSIAKDQLKATWDFQSLYLVICLQVAY